MVAYARSCHTARFYPKTLPACAHLYNSPRELGLTDIFDLESLSFAPPDAEVKKVFPVLYLLGNTIYMKSDCCDTVGVDGVIVNCDMCERMSGVAGVSQRSYAGFMSQEDERWIAHGVQATLPAPERMMQKNSYRGFLDVIMACPGCGWEVVEACIWMQNHVQE